MPVLRDAISRRFYHRLSAAPQPASCENRAIETQPPVARKRVANTARNPRQEIHRQRVIAGRGSAPAGHAGVLPRVPRVPGLPPRVLGRVARPPDARVGGRVAVWIRPRDLVDSGPRACRGLPRRAPIAASASPPASRLLPRPYRTGTFAFSSTNQFWIRLMRVISAAGRRLVLVSRKRWPSRSRS